MNTGNYETEKLNLEKERLSLDKERLALEKTFSKKYSTSLIGLMGVIIAGLFAYAQVTIANLQKDNELHVRQLQSETERRDAADERNRRWNLDLTDFVLKNKEALFTPRQTEDQERIIKVIAITFPEHISKILFENIKTAVPKEQKAVVAVGQRIAADIQLQKKATQTYYVIAMTSESKDEIQTEINRVKNLVGNSFNSQFPSVTIYAPQGGLYTLLVSSKNQSFAQANALKQNAIKAGFSKETWLWQSNEGYFRDN